ncbi:MAG TPA: CocE/NonD family hydrolase [Bacteroidetes bacterium]|nr:CocE/NonD family hydrolase [Bacteroidota bacterium]
MMIKPRHFILTALLLCTAVLPGSSPAWKPESKEVTSADYDKYEYRIPMRDGVHLFTSVYIPKDHSHKYPVLLIRTPYSVRPYGKEKKRRLGPSGLFMQEKYIFVYQDVRGRFMSEGTFVNMRPMHNHKKNPKAVDESTDTWDTVDWLVKNIKECNGNVGIWGISYPGFYSSCAAVDAHPAVKAISPQAPIADWFWDDFHHHGAFFLPHAFNFLAVFGQPRPKPTTKWGKRFSHGTPDGYKFFMDLGPLSNVNKKYYHGNIHFWDEITNHPNYDYFWQERNLLPHLKKIRPAILVVGGWYDAEDLYGTFATYQAMEKNSPGGNIRIVIGPWRHSGWASSSGNHLGYIWFTTDPTPSEYYRNNIEFPFFQYYLKGKGRARPAEATMYITGSNEWKTFDTWPPQNTVSSTLFFAPDHQLSFSEPSTTSYDEFISDPAKAVPYTELITTGMSAQYMTDDQRFAGRRPDVLVYQTPPLEQDITFAGKLMADLYVSTTGTAADWIVKLIDVYPDDFPDFEGNPPTIHMGGYQQMVRSEVFRGRFRNSYEHPEPFVPNKVTFLKFPLQDVLHTFKKGHRIMVQVQSTWFPLVDLNPQKYVDNIYLDAKPEDFIKATHRIYTGKEHASRIEFRVLK